jgi:CheY-like chemotaxis protein
MKLESCSYAVPFFVPLVESSDLLPDLKRPRVFIVDDEQIIARTLAIILEQSGYSATAFFDPLQALVAAGVDAPDLLISDVVMPQLSGIDLAIRLQLLCPKCKVLLFSGQAQTADLLRAARDQGHDFSLLSKPVHPTDLLSRLREQQTLDISKESSVMQGPSY